MTGPVGTENGRSRAPNIIKPGPYGTGQGFATLPAPHFDRQVNVLLAQPDHVARPTSGAHHHASLARRLGAAVYDAFAVVALWFAATALVLGLVTRGEAVPPGSLPFMLYLTVVAMAYFVWSWRAAGQTLGMRAWGIRVTRQDGRPPGTARLAARFLAAAASWGCLGLGFLWALSRRDRQTWHDLATGTRLIRAQAKVRRR